MRMNQCLLLSNFFWEGIPYLTNVFNFQNFIPFILLIWGPSSIQDPLVFLIPLPKSTFRAKLVENWDLETIFELLAKEKTTQKILACWGIEIELNNFANNNNDKNKPNTNLLKLTFVITKSYQMCWKWHSWYQIIPNVQKWPKYWDFYSIWSNQMS